MAAPSLRNLTRADYQKPAQNQHVPLQDLVKPHVESFNYVLREGLQLAVASIPPVAFQVASGDKISLQFTDADIGVPKVPVGNVYANNLQVYPSECRQRGTSYQAKLTVHIQWSTSNGQSGMVERQIGQVPIMVKSNNCNLHNLSPSQLIAHKEDAEEMGGYFIVNGIERIIRMLIMPRRNFPMAINRPKWKTRGKAYTEFGVTMRCVSKDQSSMNLTMHYLNNGTATLSFAYQKEIFFIPLILILKALIDTTDQHIYKELLKGRENNTFYIGCVIGMLRQTQDKNLVSQKAILQYIGERFAVKLGLPSWYTPEENAQFLFKHSICIHLDSNLDKFNALILMARKLFAFVRGECAAENADSPMNQEVLLAGHLYQMVLKEKMEQWMTNLRYTVEKKAKTKPRHFELTDDILLKACHNVSDISRAMEYLLATGNVVSKTGLGLMQATGMTIVADKLNFMRFMSHFRCVHRGSFFAEMRTTSVRKLLPEAWGFLCPVHTPDGAPCGLLNHLTALCQVINTQQPTSQMVPLLCSLGMVPQDGPDLNANTQSYEVALDGRVLGYVGQDQATQLVEKLRTLKVKGLHGVPPTLEIVLVPITGKASQYPGLYLFSTPARLMRPVQHLATDSVELIGTFEQVYLNVAVIPSEAHEGLTTHLELNEGSLLSAVASLTPYSDFNQSPRNMYQCQMGKQTMGFPSHTLRYRNDHKMYRIQTPQSPLVRPYAHDHYNIDEYPLGTNAVVAVISYTGYDMEDAMVINRASLDRGFAHGTIHKTEEIDLKKKANDQGSTLLVFGCDPSSPQVNDKLDSDGFPYVATVLQPGDPLYGFTNVETGQVRIEKYKGTEVAVVDHVKVIGNDLGNQECQRAFIQLRIERNPIIGDKFSSRHGQKGVCSQRWPVENMPFSESGMTPDIIFNPHGFPSRMTIGMMIESMAGKSGCLHGLCHDATPFTFSEKQPAIEYFGKLLSAAGYNHYGTERMYSGVTGVELEADIFIGVVYYQRLRHMVSDKFQVRSTGPIDVLTHQPVKGRKRAGGIRFGEMERDSLLAHGTSFLLQDRLFNCSDKSLTRVCAKCGSMLGIHLEQLQGGGLHMNDNDGTGLGSARKWLCTVCNSPDNVSLVAVPYVFQYLVAELAAMSIKVTLDIK
ncbi:LOW QUALITY PROTEIN: DNA-directed RNA polymerase I subunit RPA2-like [Amphiura filiformis]|uniref:LOW QUALITY PROTEIN: DNA-directed RNA polymerase I subunit RPA2-like n=1 Tax=Amphiura filiformis TaxID=82378 RepID=UPI003B21062A